MSCCSAWTRTLLQGQAQDVCGAPRLLQEPDQAVPRMRVLYELQAAHLWYTKWKGASPLRPQSLHRMTCTTTAGQHQISLPKPCSSETCTRAAALKRSHPAIRSRQAVCTFKAS